RFSRDWSSDVCSSDLAPLGEVAEPVAVRTRRPGGQVVVAERGVLDPGGVRDVDASRPAQAAAGPGARAAGGPPPPAQGGSRHDEIGRASWRGGGQRAV